MVKSPMKRLSDTVKEQIGTKVKCFNAYNHSETGTISQINFTIEQNGSVSIKNFEIKFDEVEKGMKPISTHNLIGKHFMLIGLDKIKLNEITIDTEAFENEENMMKLRNIFRVGSFGGATMFEKEIIRKLKTEKIYGHVVKTISKEEFPNSIDTIFVSRKESAKEVTSLLQIPLDFVVKDKKLEQITQLPNSKELTKLYLEYEKEYNDFYKDKEQEKSNQMRP